MPAEVSVFLLNVVDRFYLYRTGPGGPGAAGLYSLAVKFAVWSVPAELIWEMPATTVIAFFIAARS